MTTELTIWEAPKLPEIRKSFAKDLSDVEFGMFVQLGVATGLNPFLREIWAVKYGSNAAQIFVGRDGYRKGAQRHPLYEYHVCDAVYTNDLFGAKSGEVVHEYKLGSRGELVGAYCIVKRKYAEKPCYVFVELKEYSTGKSLWQTKPATMIKKVAEAQCLRMAFQDLFGGTYAEEEAWKQGQENPNAKDSEKLSLRSKLGIPDAEDGKTITVPSQLESILTLVENAKNLDELKKAGQYAKSLSDEDKEVVRPKYEEKQASLKEVKDDL